jgi:hypothetical protein
VPDECLDFFTPMGYIKMTLITIVETPTYLADAERLLTDAERLSIIEDLAANPTQGVLIKGTGGLRKMRIGFGGRGKRGGGRVIYWFHADAYPVVMLAMFAKNEAADLTSKERAILGHVAAQLLNDFRS